MRLRLSDLMATALVAAALIVYGLWVTDTAFTDTSTRIIASMVFVLGFAACSGDTAGMASALGAAGHRRAPVLYLVATVLAGVVALVAAVASLVTASGAWLATLVGAMFALWALATARHLLTPDIGAAEVPADDRIDTTV